MHARSNMPAFNGYNPAWGQVSAEQLWGVTEADVIKNKMTPAAAVDKTFRRAEQIFAKYHLAEDECLSTRACRRFCLIFSAIRLSKVIISGFALTMLHGMAFAEN
jgi:hypothetical protein